MSLRNIVVCVAGDLSSDAFIDQDTEGKWWVEENIRNAIKSKHAKLVSEMSPSVTHLVCSRAAYKAGAPEIRYVEKLRKRFRSEKSLKKVTKIVTYDWLEDSLNLGRVIDNVAAYDPGKPRDIDAMVAACSTRQSKHGKKTAGDGKGDGKNACSGEPASPVAKSKTETSNDDNVSDQAKITKDLRVSKPSAATAENTDSKGTKKSGGTSGVEGAKSAGDITQKKATAPAVPEKAKEADWSIDWKINAKARPFVDKHDGFAYRIGLTGHDGRRWDLALYESADGAAVPKSFMFLANHYDAKLKLLNGAGGQGEPVRELRTALDEFKRFFFTKTNCKWDERVLRADALLKGGGYHYRVPEEGKPRGSVPPQFTPGNPECVKMPDSDASASQTGGTLQHNPLKRKAESSIDSEDRVKRFGAAKSNNILNKGRGLSSACQQASRVGPQTSRSFDDSNLRKTISSCQSKSCGPEKNE